MSGLQPSRPVGPGLSTAVRASIRQHYFGPHQRSRVITPPPAAATATAAAKVEVVPEEMHELEILIGCVPPNETRKPHRATLQWTPLLGDFWLTEVLDEGGVVVESGVGDDPLTAYLDLCAHAIPRE